MDDIARNLEEPLGDLDMYIGGEWVESRSGARDDVINPATGKAIGTVPAGTREDAQRAIAAAAEAEDTLRWMTPAERSAMCKRVFEIHPELAFRTMKGEPLTYPKKIKGVVNPPGMAERRALLQEACLPLEAVSARPPRGAAADDLLDTLAALVVARHIAAGRGKPFPDPQGRDSHGLPIAIWTFVSQTVSRRIEP